jgi:hypothetical protein
MRHSLSASGAGMAATMPLDEPCFRCEAMLLVPRLSGAGPKFDFAKTFEASTGRPNPRI